MLLENVGYFSKAAKHSSYFEYSKTLLYYPQNEPMKAIKAPGKHKMESIKNHFMDHKKLLSNIFISWKYMISKLLLFLLSSLELAFSFEFQIFLVPWER